ncbi:hypothetical protein PR048_002765, partial [Dryococelus australis]
MAPYRKRDYAHLNLVVLAGLRAPLRHRVVSFFRLRPAICHSHVNCFMVPSEGMGRGQRLRGVRTTAVAAAEGGLRSAALLIKYQKADLYLSTTQQITLCTNTEVISQPMFLRWTRLLSQEKCFWKSRQVGLQILRLEVGGTSQTVPHQDELGSIPGRVTPGFSQVGFVPNYAASRRVYSGISRFPRTCIPELLHSHLISPLSTLQDLVFKSRPNLSTHFQTITHLSLNGPLAARAPKVISNHTSPACQVLPQHKAGALVGHTLWPDKALEICREDGPLKGKRTTRAAEHEAKALPTWLGAEPKGARRGQDTPTSGPRMRVAEHSGVTATCCSERQPGSRGLKGGLQSSHSSRAEYIVEVSLCWLGTVCLWRRSRYLRPLVYLELLEQADFCRHKFCTNQTVPFNQILFLTGGPRWLSDYHALLPLRRTGLNPRPGHRTFASGNRAGRCRWSAGLFGDLPFSPSNDSGAVPFSLQSPSSALKTSLLRAAKISSLILSLLKKNTNLS